MNKKHSAGGILFNKKGQIYLIYKAERDEWALPKGGVEIGETTAQAASREIKEETGYKKITILSPEPIHSISFIYTRKETGEEEEKITDFYIFEVGEDTQEKTKEMAEEGWTGKWMNPDEALTKISFDNLKEAIKKSLEFKKLA